MKLWPSYVERSSPRLWVFICLNETLHFEPQDRENHSRLTVMFYMAGHQCCATLPLRSDNTLFTEELKPKLPPNETIIRLMWQVYWGVLLDGIEHRNVPSREQTGGAETPTAPSNCMAERRDLWTNAGALFLWPLYRKTPSSEAIGSKQFESSVLRAINHLSNLLRVFTFLFKRCWQYGKFFFFFF